ncbi:GGDEF domain-containing protein [Vibrio sp. T187]|uniref:GGDEF domain-containing protein n=1 Tax=Vibrio TaxID=662 RepID=UPI0010C990E1|nr:MULTISPECIES: GGDEF domain-containing protein [Vibrio]MBW3694918.1 GGDEF domain-containing protein [Vibrio sp. T187]
MKSKSVHTQYPHLRLAKVLLLATSAVLLIANIVLMKDTRTLAESYTEQQNQATWFLFQLTKELSELVSESSHIGDGDDHLSSVLLKYDLAWSRFDLILSSKESDSFMTIPDARRFFESLFKDFQALEPIVNQIKGNEAVKGEEFHGAIQGLYLDMIDYVNRNFRVKSPLYEARQTKARTLQSLQLQLLVGFMFCLVLISVVFYKESRYHQKLAMTDTLTDLGNRLAMFTKMERYHQTNKPFTLYLLDLDGFKAINDKFGHQEGDRVLVDFAHHIKGFECEDYKAYRMGGDEFAILHSDCSLESEHQVLDYIDLLYSNEELCFKVEEHLGVSVGVANYPDDATDIDELVGVADKRMYQMKFCNKQDKQEVKKQV